jgi:DeoR family transcriptional regulator of aga operon
VEREGYCGVAELSVELAVSTVTIRGDLERLDREGQVRRVHGGAVRAKGYA